MEKFIHRADTTSVTVTHSFSYTLCWSFLVNWWKITLIGWVAREKVGERERHRVWVWVCVREKGRKGDFIPEGLLRNHCEVFSSPAAHNFQVTGSVLPAWTNPADCMMKVKMRKRRTLLWELRNTCCEEHIKYCGNARIHSLYAAALPSVGRHIWPVWLAISQQVFDAEPIVMLEKFGSQSAGVPVSGADLALKLTEKKSSPAAAAGVGMENDTGKKLLEITGPAVSNRKLLVALDLLCLFLGKYTNTQITWMYTVIIVTKTWRAPVGEQATSKWLKLHGSCWGHVTVFLFDTVLTDSFTHLL